MFQRKQIAKKQKANCKNMDSESTIIHEGLSMKISMKIQSLLHRKRLMDITSQTELHRSLIEMNCY